MKNISNRRNFIKKAIALSSATAISLRTGFALNKPMRMKTNAVSKIKPLGFQWQTQDPFLFCVHHEDYYPKGNNEMGPDEELLQGRNIGQDFVIKNGFRMYHGEKVPGFPGHPHRGFETVTIVRKGIVDHSDSLGGACRYGNGDVQWMTAGKGVQHAEMFPLVNSDKDNPLELFQIWLNLPKTGKFVNPHYKMLWENSIPKHISTDAYGKKTLIEIIAGKIEKTIAPAPPPNSWAATNNNEVAIWNIHMDAQALWTLPKTSSGVNRTVYFYKGNKIEIDGIEIENYHSAEINSESEITIKNGNEKAYILILQGKPINEPVVQYGPFVMNSKKEIQEAFADYQETKFGGWPWETNSPVHDRAKGRFALHADGTLEEKD